MFLLALFSFVALATGRDAVACSCAAIDPVRWYAHDSLIVLVKVTALETRPAPEPWNVKLLVLKTWKGSVKPGSEARVRTPGPRGPCGFFIRSGDQLIVYANDAPAVPDVGLCNTARDSDVQNQARILDAVRARGLARPPDSPVQLH
jgi:hypothetical protein